MWDEDLRQFYQAVGALPNFIQRDLALLGLFTGMRENEAAGLKWEEVDFRHRTIKLAAVRMKAKKPFDLPMSDFVRDLLVARQAVGYDGPFVFPSGGFNNDLTFLMIYAEPLYLSRRTATYRPLL